MEEMWPKRCKSSPDHILTYERLVPLHSASALRTAYEKSALLLLADVRRACWK